MKFDDIIKEEKKSLRDDGLIVSDYRIEWGTRHFDIIISYIECLVSYTLKGKTFSYLGILHKENKKIKGYLVKKI